MYNNKIYIGESINALDPNYIGYGKYWKSIIIIFNGIERSNYG